MRLRVSATCEELEQLLRSLTNDEGRPLVTTCCERQTTLLAGSSSLPISFRQTQRSLNLDVRKRAACAAPIGTKFTEGTALKGFCIVRGPEDIQQVHHGVWNGTGQMTSRILVSDMLTVVRKLPKSLGQLSLIGQDLTFLIWNFAWQFKLNHARAGGSSPQEVASETHRTFGGRFHGPAHVFPEL